MTESKIVALRIRNRLAIILLLVTVMSIMSGSFIAKSLGPAIDVDFVFYAPLSMSGVGDWKSTTNYPTNIAASSCVVNSGYVYCVGGTISSNSYVDTVYYAPFTSPGLGNWKVTTHYPTAVGGESCVANSGYIYCVGGVTPGQVWIRDVYYATLNSSGVGAWFPTTWYPTSVAPEQGCLVFLGDIFCVAGRVDSNTAFTDAVYYAPLSSSGVGSWSPTTNYPVQLDGNSIVTGSCLVDSSYGYCFGGYTYTGSEDWTSAVYYAQFSSSGVSAWTSTMSYQANVVGQSCVANSGYVYCVTGETPNDLLIRDVYYASLNTSGVGAWRSTTHYPYALDGERCVLNSGYVYCIGGAPYSITNPPNASVGGRVIPVNKLELLAPFLALAAVLATGTVLTTVYVKRRLR